MKITRIETIPVRVPIRPNLAIRGRLGYHSESPFLLVRVHTDEGLVGLGEVSATPRWSGEDQVTAAHVISTYLAPLLTGQDPTAVTRLSALLRTAVAGNFFTKAALEMALWDILGKSVGLPLYRLFGGPVRETVAIKWSVSGVEPARAAEIVAWAVDRGFRAMKVKVGIDPAADVERVRAVRSAVGKGVRLGVDANGAWSVAEAVAMIERFREHEVAFVEQPVAARDLAGLAEVRRRVTVPIVADESVGTPEDAVALVRAAAADVFSVYVGKGGGIEPARRVAAIAEAAGLAATVGSNLELGVASAAMIHLALSTSGIADEQVPCDIIGPLFYEADLLRQPLDLSGGRARPPEAPGLGVELDDEKVRRYRVE